MARKAPQFSTERPGLRGPAYETPPSNRALYTIPNATAGESPTLVLVECLEGGGNVPRNATFFEDLKLNLRKEMESVARVAETAIETLKMLSPGEVEIEFGIQLGGKAGIPLITKSEGKANFKVTLKWTRPERAAL